MERFLLLFRHAPTHRSPWCFLQAPERLVREVQRYWTRVNRNENEAKLDSIVSVAVDNCGLLSAFVFTK